MLIIITDIIHLIIIIIIIISMEGVHACRKHYTTFDFVTMELIIIYINFMNNNYCYFLYNFHYSHDQE